jgi:prepilin-type N-terminal cleavage/methylation domain-containing protein
MLGTLNNRKGFTLVELAIVLVIIGIILGAVLKGQELINSARMKRVYSQYRETLAAVLTYQDKYGKLPGDDNSAGLATRWNPVTYYSAGNGNGQITGGATGTNAAPGTMFTCAAGTATETCGEWDHMRRANIITGPLNGTNPTNPFGGTVGISYVTISTLLTNWIGMSNVPSDIAQSIDQQYDDGDGTTGDIRTLAAYVAGSKAPILIFFRLQ